MYKLYIKARSSLLADLIKQWIINKLENDGKLEFLDWLKKVYFNDAWCNFYHTSVQTPGVEPTQQHIEACNKGIKSMFPKPLTMTDMISKGIF